MRAFAGGDEKAVYMDRASQADVAFDEEVSALLGHP